MKPARPSSISVLAGYPAGGACLQSQEPADLPQRLHGTIRKHCRLVWKRRLRLGVAL